jgi:hypothetical protein
MRVPASSLGGVGSVTVTGGGGEATDGAGGPPGASDDIHGGAKLGGPGLMGERASCRSRNYLQLCTQAVDELRACKILTIASPFSATLF